MIKTIKQILLLLFIPLIAMSGNSFHVTPTGSASSPGTVASPWTLTYAGNASQLNPGDTVWIHGGTYPGTFTFQKSGTSTAPIVYRNYQGQRATIDAGSTLAGAGSALLPSGSYLWVWGLEVMSSAKTKAGGNSTYGNFSWPDNIGQPEGIGTDNSSGRTPGIKIIRCIVHDTRQGFSHWNAAVDCEVVDCIFSDNGWYDTNGDAHGHNWYIQTKSMDGTTTFTNNINERSYDNAFQLYGSATTYGDLVSVENNIFSQCGSNVGKGNGRNGFFGPGHIGYNDVFRGNISYTDMGINLLVSSGNGTPGMNGFIMTGNTMLGQGSGLTLQGLTNPTITGNKIFYGGGAPESTYPSNTWTTVKPSTWDGVTIHPFKYEKGAHIVVINTTGVNSKSVDFSSFLSSGDTYTVLDAQNYYGSPLVTGTYSNGMVSIPLNSTSLPAVVGNDPRQSHHTSKEFNVFVVVSNGSVALPPPPVATLPVITLSINPSSLTATGAVTINYSVTSNVAYTASIDQGVGTITGVGSKSVSVSTNTTYTLTAINSAGTSTKTASVSVVVPPPPPPPPPVTDTTFHVGSQVMVVMSTNCLNERTAPSISSAIIKCMKAGTKGTIIAGPVSTPGYRFWQITWSDGSTGWSADIVLTVTGVVIPPPPIISWANKYNAWTIPGQVYNIRMGNADTTIVATWTYATPSSTGGVNTTTATVTYRFTKPPPSVEK